MTDFSLHPRDLVSASMGNPRRDAIEYGVLVTLTASMAAGYAILIAYANQRTPDGQRRKLPRVELDKPVDLGEMWAEMKDFGRGIMSSDEQQQQKQHQQGPHHGSANSAILPTGDKTSSSWRGMDNNVRK